MKANLVLLIKQESYMKFAIVIVSVFFPMFLNAQEKGVLWSNESSWAGILKKAKNEGKYIFVDCYTTWCMPCHRMDKEVYPNEEVGEAINSKFICVKVQFDRTDLDNELIKNWYSESSRLQRLYTITAFPTFLFFDSTGTPLHKAIGYKNLKDFISLTKDALNPEKQYYAILRNYQPGKLDTSELKGLARSFKKTDKELAEKLAVEYLTRLPKSKLGTKDNLTFMAEFTESLPVQNIASSLLSGISVEKYMSKDYLVFISAFKKSPAAKKIVINYLNRQSKKQLFNQLQLLTIFKNDSAAKQIADKYVSELSPRERLIRANLQLVTSFMQTSNEPGFKMFYGNPEKIDSVMGQKGYADNMVQWIIDHEEVWPYIKDVDKTENVKWDEISRNIENKYNKKHAEVIVVKAKARFYEHRATRYDTNWPEYIKYYIEKVEKFGTDTTSGFVDATQLNNFVFDAIFFHSNDLKEIETGLRWMEGVIRRNPKDPNNMDTYSNLLYKAGKTKEAILWQEKAVKIAIEEKQDWCLPSLKDNLAKMKSGKPTWIKNAVN
jgi:thioredoxin-related protein